jgi:hypothetical protein
VDPDFSITKLNVFHALILTVKYVLLKISVNLAKLHISLTSTVNALKNVKLDHTEMQLRINVLNVIRPVLLVQDQENA